MKKILFISTRYPFPIFGADKLRSFDILKFLSKKNKIDLVCLGDKKEIKNKNLSFCSSVKVFQLNFISRIINIIISLFKLEPLQNGYYLSTEMKSFINSNKHKYDSIICHLLRSSQYMPAKFEGKKVLEMTDLTSSNYQQSIKQLPYLNPLKYIYFIEKLLVERYEKKILKKFDNIVFVSNIDAKKAREKISNKGKICVIGSAQNFNTKIFKYKKNNNKIIFIGNINYLPNKLACKDFAKNVLKKINLKYPEIKFHVIGNIGYLNKFFLQRHKNVIIHGKVNNLKNVITNSICGLCNVKISTGFQYKILTYMSYGIPAVVSTNSFVNTKLKKNKEVLVFSNNDKLIEKILYLKNNKRIANLLSKNSHMVTKKKYDRNKVLLKYNKII